jgi:predicted TIM-barrel fold metal-dependent hydrolase
MKPRPPLPQQPEAAASAVPSRLRHFRIVDAHVHVFPRRLFEAVRRWFDCHGWSIRYRPAPRACAAFLEGCGIENVVALQYAHKPGMAAELNSFLAGITREDPALVPCGTVFPGEEGARQILDEALGPLGLRGLKIHCHVQCVAPDDSRLDDVYDAAAAHGVPVIIHAGDAPASTHYGCDVLALCTPEALDRALRRHGRTTVVVPHLGAGRMEEVVALLDRHEHLHLDTTMALARYFPVRSGSWEPDEDRTGPWLDRALAVLEKHSTRILYGSDFPNIPYAWDRELRTIASLDLPDRVLAAVLGDNARNLFGLAGTSGKARGAG